MSGQIIGGFIACRRGMALSGLLLLWGSMLLCAQAGAAPVRVEPAFGHRIGDSIVATGRLAMDDGALLDQASLPKLGRVNGWLDLRDVQVTAGDGYREVVRVFLVTASDIAPKMLFLPKAELKFRLAGRELVEQLESVPVTVSPLTPAEPILRAGFGELRPDRDVPDPQAARAARTAGWLAVVLASLAAISALLRWLALRRRGFAPFGLAARRLRRLARPVGASGVDPEVSRRAFRILHEAFNETAGEALFAAHVERFLVGHPRLGAEGDSVREFFRRSDAFFFGTRPSESVDPTWLAGLARRLARLEQPGR